ncbi:MAG: hypothetical protein AB3P07_01885 [Wolbachia pipientis]
MTTVLQEKVVAENANLKEKIVLIRENDSLVTQIVELKANLELEIHRCYQHEIYTVEEAKKKSDKDQERTLGSISTWFSFKY